MSKASIGLAILEIGYRVFKSRQTRRQELRDYFDFDADLNSKQQLLSKDKLNDYKA